MGGICQVLFQIFLNFFFKIPRKKKTEFREISSEEIETRALKRKSIRPTPRHSIFIRQLSLDFFSI